MASPSRWQRASRQRHKHAQNASDLSRLLQGLVDKYELIEQTLADEESASQKAFKMLMQDLKVYAPDPKLKYQAKALLRHRRTSSVTEEDPEAPTSEDFPKLIPANALWAPLALPATLLPPWQPPVPDRSPTREGFTFDPRSQEFFPGAGEGVGVPILPPKWEPVGAPLPAGPCSFDWGGSAVEWAHARPLEDLLLDAGLCGLFEPTFVEGLGSSWEDRRCAFADRYCCSGKEVDALRERYMNNPEALKVLKMRYHAHTLMESRGITNDIAGWLPISAAMWEAKGNKHFMKQQFEEAVEMFNNAIATDPNAGNQEMQRLLREAQGHLA